MTSRNKAVNIITAILAVLLSILLVLSLFATGLVAAVSSTTSPATIRNLITNAVQEIDFEQIIIDSAQDNNISEEQLAQARTITALLDSPVAKEFFSLYAQDVAATLSGTYDPANAAVSVASITALANDHIDDLVDIVGAVDTAVDKEQIRQEVLKFVEENAAELLESVKIENIVDVEGLSEITQVLALLKTATWIMLGVCLVLGGLIYACRYYRFGGFIWLGVDSGIAALMVLGVMRLIRTPLVVNAVVNEPSSGMLLSGMLSAVGGVLLTVALILLGITVLFIGLFILLKYTVLSKRDAAAIPTEEILMEEVSEETPTEDSPVEEAAL